MRMRLEDKECPVPRSGEIQVAGWGRGPFDD